MMITMDSSTCCCPVWAIASIISSCHVKLYWTRNSGGVITRYSVTVHSVWLAAARPGWLATVPSNVPVNIIWWFVVVVEMICLRVKIVVSANWRCKSPVTGIEIAATLFRHWPSPRSWQISPTVRAAKTIWIIPAAVATRIKRRSIRFSSSAAGVHKQPGSTTGGNS